MVLSKWMDSLDSLGMEYDIHAYNDGSKDNSLLILNDYAARTGKRIVVHDKPNSGHGPTILSAYLQNCGSYEWLFQMDSDDEMGPAGFGELWERRNDYDFLAGIRDGRMQPLSRKIISAVSRLTVRLFYGKSIWDVNCPYRLMRASGFSDIYRAVPANTFAPNIIISGYAAKSKLRCFESYVPYEGRKTGEVSIKKWKLLKAALKSFAQTVMFSFRRPA